MISAPVDVADPHMRAAFVQSAHRGDPASQQGCSHGRVVRSGARCSSTSSARLLQGRGFPPSPADGIGGWRSRGTDQGCGGSDCVARGGHVGPDGTVRGPTPPARLPRPPTTWGISICRQPPPPAAIVDHAQPQMTHREQRPPGMAREKESSWSGPGHRSTAAPSQQDDPHCLPRSICENSARRERHGVLRDLRPASCPPQRAP